MIERKAKFALAAGALAAVLNPVAVQAAGDRAGNPVEYRYAVASAATQPQYLNVVGHRYVVKRRSKKKSAAIVGGSAAGGAAIGALAGGGKGAGIGALTGGAAGFIYDRKTHKKVVRQY
ncbi:MAG TPA: hypothetical protein VGV35_17590 [Bryobacteraceae bacterium]|nr:hypothetical protein [Bryobacteraceae bacterium]